MKRRNFTQSIIAALSVASLPVGVTAAMQLQVHDLLKNNNVTSEEGLKLKLNQKIHPLKNKDDKQFILTYGVENSVSPLEEKIYSLKTASGQTHQVYMTPVGDNQLQAVFNWRLNA